MKSQQHGQIKKKKRSILSPLIIGVLACGTLQGLSIKDALAQQSAKEGLQKLEENIENSDHNIQQYQKNLKTVDENLIEIKKAQDAVQAELKKILDQSKAHQLLSKKMTQQEQEIDKLMKAEKANNEKDEARLKEIEKLIAQIKQNQEQRTRNQQEYERQLAEIQNHRKQWQIHADSLKSQEDDIKKNLAEVKEQNSTWSAKKKGYEGEIKRWTAESGKQKSALKTMKSLAESPNQTEQQQKKR